MVSGRVHDGTRHFAMTTVGQIPVSRAQIVRLSEPAISNYLDMTGNVRMLHPNRVTHLQGTTNIRQSAWTDGSHYKHGDQFDKLRRQAAVLSLPTSQSCLLLRDVI